MHDNSFVQHLYIPAHPKMYLSSITRFFSKNRTHNLPTVSWLLEHREERQNKPALTQGRTPTASLYRMYEYIVTGFVTELRNEIEYFYNQPWTVSKIPDPTDTDPERYAILAVIPYYLVKAYHRLAEQGLPRGSPAIITSQEMKELRSRESVREEVPEWVKSVPRLEKTLVIPTNDREVPDEESRSERYLGDQYHCI